MRGRDALIDTPIREFNANEDQRRFDQRARRLISRVNSRSLPSPRFDATLWFDHDRVATLNDTEVASSKIPRNAERSDGYSRRIPNVRSQARDCARTLIRHPCLERMRCINK